MGGRPHEVSKELGEAPSDLFGLTAANVAAQVRELVAAAAGTGR